MVYSAFCAVVVSLHVVGGRSSRKYVLQIGLIAVICDVLLSEIMCSFVRSNVSIFISDIFVYRSNDSDFCWHLWS